MSSIAPWLTEKAMSEFRERSPRRPRPSVAPYSHPSEGSTLILLDEPSNMTKMQIVSWSEFNK